MRVKNAGRFKWMLLKTTQPVWSTNPGNPFRMRSVYKVVKTGRGGAAQYDGAYENWDLIAEYDDPKLAYAMLELINVSNKPETQDDE